MLPSSLESGPLKISYSLKLRPSSEGKYNVDQCAICLLSYEENPLETKVSLVCGHVFHAACLKAALRSASGMTCPLDRKPLAAKVKSISFALHPCIDLDVYNVLLRQGILSRIIDATLAPENAGTIAPFFEKYLQHAGSRLEYHGVSKRIQKVGQAIFDNELQIKEDSTLPSIEAFQMAFNHFKILFSYGIDHFVQPEEFAACQSGSAINLRLINLLQLVTSDIKQLEENLKSSHPSLEKWISDFLVKISDGAFASLPHDEKKRYLDICIPGANELISDAANLLKSIDDTLYLNIAKKVGPKSSMKRHFYILCSSSNHIKFIQTILQNREDPLSIDLKHKIIAQARVGDSLKSIVYWKVAIYLRNMGYDLGKGSDLTLGLIVLKYAPLLFAAGRITHRIMPRADEDLPRCIYRLHPHLVDAIKLFLDMGVAGTTFIAVSAAMDYAMRGASYVLPEAYYYVFFNFDNAVLYYKILCMIHVLNMLFPNLLDTIQERVQRQISLALSDT